MAVATMQQVVLAVLFVLCLPLLTVEELVDQVVVKGEGIAPIVAVPHALEFGVQQVCVVDVMQLSLVVPEDAEVEYVKVLGWSAPRDVVQLPNFEATIIPRGENGTFQVVLLPVELGNTKSVLFLETSVGRVAVSVTAYSRMNVLGVTPLYDAFAQVNTLFQAAVRVYNLDAEGVVQIHEIYTTEDFFHIRLDPDSKWEIKPHDRENVARITFQSHIQGDYRGYYRVKTNKVNLLVPVHVTVREKGLFAHPALVDLGDVAISESGDLSFLPSDTFKWHTLRSPRQMRVSLCNFKETPVRITRVLVVSSRRELMSSSRPASAGPIVARYLRGLELPAGAVQRSAIVLELNLDLANKESLVANKRYTGHVIVHTNETNPQYAQIVIPYSFSVKRPAIVYQPEVLQIACGGLNLEQKTANVYWKNTLATPLLVSGLSIQGLAVGPQVRFTSAAISTQLEGSVIEPGETLGPFEVSLPNPSMLLPSMVEETQAIVLTTNATMVAIPITFFHGRLHYRPIKKPGSSSKVDDDRAHLHAGKVALGSSLGIRFELSNPSAKAVSVQKVTPVPSHPGLKMSISLVGGAELERHTIPPFQNVEFVCELKVPQVAPRTLGFGVIVETDYEELKMGASMFPVPVIVESFLRNLPPSPFSAHIGEQVQYGDLHVNFEHSEPLRIIGYASQDSRVSIVDLPEKIDPGKNIYLGKVVIDFRNCQDAQDVNCKYIADTCRGVGDTPVIISEQAQDANSLFDFVKQMSAIRARWPEIEEKGENHMSATIVLETDIIGTNIEFTVHVDKILCPLVVNNHEVLDFGSLVMGDSQQGFVQIMNPSRSQPLRIEFMLAKNIPNIGPRLPDSDTVPPVDGQVPSFSVPGDVILHALVMPPQTKTLVGPIYFSPQMHDSVNGISRSMICVVNNLTSLEPIRLEGRLTRPFIGVKESSIVNFDKFYHGSAVLRYQQVENYFFNLESSDISWRQEKLEMDVKVTQDDGYVLSKSFKLTIYNRGEARAIIESVELLETSSPGNFVVEPISQRVLLPVGGELELNLKFFSDCKEATPSAVLKVFHGSREFSVFVTNTEISEDVLKECREQTNAYLVRRVSWYGILVCCTLFAIAALARSCQKHKATIKVEKMEKVPQHIATSSKKDCKAEEAKKAKPKTKSRSPKLKLAKTKTKTKTSNPDVKEDPTPIELKHKEGPKPISPEDETAREKKNEKVASSIIHQVSVTHHREKEFKTGALEKSPLETPENEGVESDLSSAQSPDTAVSSSASEQDPVPDAFEENAPKPLSDSTVSKQNAVSDKTEQRSSPTTSIKGSSSSLSPPSLHPFSPSIAHDSSVPATPKNDDGSHSSSSLGQSLNSDHAGQVCGIDSNARSKPGRGLQNLDQAKNLRQAPKDFPRSHNTSRKQQSNWRKAKSNRHDAQTGNGISTSHGMNGSRFAKNPRNRNKTSQKDTGGQNPKSRVPAQFPLMPPPARLPVQAPHVGSQSNGSGGLHGANTSNMVAFSQPRTVDYGEGHGGQLQHKGSPPPGLVTRSLFGPSLFQEPVRDALVDAVKSSSFSTQHELRPPPPNFQQHHEKSSLHHQQPTVGPGNDIFTASQSYFEPVSQNTDTAFGLPDFSQPSDSTFLRGLVHPPIQPETRRVAPPPGLEGFPPNIYDSESTSFETRNGQPRADGYHGLRVVPPSGITTRRRSQLHDATDSPKSPGDSPFGDFGFLSNDD